MYLMRFSIICLPSLGVLVWISEYLCCSYVLRE